MIVVLLSTYNGEVYLRQQLDSILAQEKVELQLWVRDDGSTDQTLEILQEYEAKGLLHFYQGENLGPARSFMQLLLDAPDADYYAFADQDDVWKAEKLSTAVSQLDLDTPALYFGQTQLVDADLQTLPTKFISPLLTFGESLVGHFVGGCTMVFNRKLRTLINQYHPRYLQMHDIWIYLVAQGVGARIVFDSEPHILYRQHGHNAIGQGNSTAHEMQRRWKRLSSREQVRSSMAKELKEGYCSLLSTKNQEQLDLFLQAKKHFFVRCKLLLSPRYRCFDASTWRRFKLAVLLNQY